MLRAVLLTICLTLTSLYGSETVIVGISGGTGSGKTTLARKIERVLGEEVALIQQDSYYKDLFHLTPEERDVVNFDHPAAIDFNLLRQDLINLRNGRKIQKPIYNFKTHTREAMTEEVEPRRILIVDGILILTVPEIRELLDIKIYVDNADDIRLLRRIERDILERGRDFNGIKEQYMSTVKPMHDRFVEPSKWHADVIIPSTTENDVGIDLIISQLKR
jgi:uridine kinase